MLLWKGNKLLIASQESTSVLTKAMQSNVALVFYVHKLTYICYFL